VNDLQATLDDMHVLNDKSSSSRSRVDARNELRFGQDERQFMYSVARRIVHSAEAADDVAQDAMLLAYRYRDSFRGDSRYRTWLYRIASTTALGHLRRCRRAREQLAPNDEILHREVVDPQRSPEAQVGDHEEALEVQRVVEQLAPKYRDVMLLRTELTEVETARRLGISVANVKIRAHRARQRLRDALEREAVLQRVEQPASDGDQR